MKNILLTIVSSVLLLGCATTQLKSYKTLAATQAAVTAAMETYRDLSNARQIASAEREKIKARYERYQTAFDAALRTARFDLETATPVEIAALASGLILTIDSL